MGNNNPSSGIFSEPTTLNELIAYSASHFPHPDMLKGKREGVWHSYSSAEVENLVKRRALGLYHLGVRTGDRVALLAENSPEWVISDYAILACGAITVPIYTTQVASQVEFILQNAEVNTLLISSAALFNRVRSILNNVSLNHIVIFSPFEQGEKFVPLADVEQFGEELEQRQQSLYDTLRFSVKPEDTATLIYTSGTTGMPKGVVLTHKNLLSNAIDSSSVIDLDPGGDQALSFLPLTHILERTMINIYLYRGLPISFAESIEKLAENLLDIRPPVMATVPRMLEKIYEKILTRGAELSGLKRKLFDWSLRIGAQYDPEGSPSLWYRIQHAIVSALVFSKWRAAVGGRARVFISGGAALAPNVQRLFLAAGIPIYQGYGLTETSPVIAVNTVNRNRLGCVGHPIPNVVVKIADDGEILMQGPGVMKEFYKSPEATAAVFENGWFKTGDIGYLDKDGFLFITDRKKDMFKKSTGKFVIPGPIEGNLCASRYVENAIVLGEARKFSIAILFPNFQNLTAWAKDQQITYQSNAELVRHPQVQQLYEREVAEVNKGLNKWERVVKFIISDHSLSIEEGLLTPTMKVRRREVEKRFRETIDALYAQYEHIEVHEE